MRRELLPVERLLFQSSLVQVGRFDCPAGDALFRDSGPILNDIVVFPRSTVGIRHDGKPLFVSDSTRVNFYNSGQKYTRSAVDSRDRCDWIAVDRETACELTREATRPFPWTFAPLAAELFLEERRMIDALIGGRLDVLQAEESFLALVAAVAEGAQRAWCGDAKGDDATSMRHRDVAEEAKAILERPRERAASLRELAKEIGVSPFHLSRTFRRVTGMTIAAYRKQLQLRRAAEEVVESETDLSRIAIENSFSSHSHLTKDFRKAFGITPSAARRTAHR